MQEIVVDWIFGIPIIISMISLIISIMVYVDSRKKEQIRKKERMIDALSQAHTLLDEALRMHPSMNTELAFVFPDGFADEINKKADTLVELSWICEDFNQDIREGASILKSLVLIEYAAMDGYLSNRERKELLERISIVRHAIWNHLENLHV
jgi:hypothetical protein